MKLLRKRRGFNRAKTYFLPFFNQQVALVKQASSALNTLATTEDKSEWPRLGKEIKQCEVKGDAILAEFYEAFYDVFMLLIDRDDLQAIAANIDRFLDQINSCAKSVMLYMPEQIAPQIVEMASCIDRAADALQSIIVDFEDMKKNADSIAFQCERITELEHAADDVYEEYVGDIFRTEKNAVDLMKYKNMAEVFESATDSAKEFSDHIRKLQFRFM